MNAFWKSATVPWLRLGGERRGDSVVLSVRLASYWPGVVVMLAMFGVLCAWPYFVNIHRKARGLTLHGPSAYWFICGSVPVGIAIGLNAYVRSRARQRCEEFWVPLKELSQHTFSVAGESIASLRETEVWVFKEGKLVWKAEITSNPGMVREAMAKVGIAESTGGRQGDERAVTRRLRSRGRAHG